MRKLLFCLTAGAVVWFFAWASPLAVAAEEGLPPAESTLDEEAATPGGSERVTQRLVTRFSVDDARINGLREENLGYGEIHHLLSLAEQMPGGITDENVNTILTMRQEQKMGWGNISKELGTKWGPVGQSQSQPEPQSLIRQGTSQATEKSKGQKWGGGGAESLGYQNRGTARGGNFMGGGKAMGGGLGEQRGKSFQAPGRVGK